MASEVTELRIEGMDCAECASHVEKALGKVPGVHNVETFPMSLKAKVKHDPREAPLERLTEAIVKAGYSILPNDKLAVEASAAGLGPKLGFVLGGVFALVLLLVVGGEATGLLDRVGELVPWYAGVVLVLAAGGTIFWKVLKDAFQRRATSHTLMSLGALAALAVGAWVTSLIVVLFMRIGERVEAYTTDRAREALRSLTRIQPQKARLVRMERSGPGPLATLRETEIEVPVGEVKVGDVVAVRPGERVPVDGVVVAGTATIDQSAITGESMPVEVEAGSKVHAATLTGLGSIRVQAERVGMDTTFGRIIKLVEDTEAHRADVQRFADKFTNYFLPVVAAVSLVTLLVTRNVLNAAAVLVIACSCSVALATPIAVLASTGASAKRGVLIKGGRYLEALAKADVLLLDKTGTITEGKPRLTDIVTLNGHKETDILRLVASAERESEHPLAQAIVTAARAWKLELTQPAHFRTMPGSGLEAVVDGKRVRVGNHRIAPDLDTRAAQKLASEGKTVVFVLIDEKPAALLAMQDTLRPGVAEALADLKAKHAVKNIELLTGDNDATARALATPLGIHYRANLLPEDKIKRVKEHQAAGRRVVMIGDGVNDAPALAQADVGIAMGSGTDVAMDAAHVVLMRDDWRLVPQAFETSRRTMRVIRGNLYFTGAFNVIGMGLAATGIVPLVYAAAAQSIPDVGILANSATLLKNNDQHQENKKMGILDRLRGKKTAANEDDDEGDHAPAPGKVQDLVCKCHVDPKTAKWHSTHEGKEYHFCAKGCKDEFDANPKAYAA